LLSGLFVKQQNRKPPSEGLIVFPGVHKKKFAKIATKNWQSRKTTDAKRSLPGGKNVSAKRTRVFLFGSNFPERYGADCKAGELPPTAFQRGDATEISGN